VAVIVTLVSAGCWKFVVGPKHCNAHRSCRCRRSSFCISGVAAINQEVSSSFVFCTNYYFFR